MSFVNMKLNKKLLVAFAPILMAVAIMGGVIWNSLSTIQTAAGWDQHTTEVLAEAQQARLGIVQKIAALRAYTISPTNNYLAALADADETFVKATDNLARLTADNPVQQERIAKLKAAGADYQAKVIDVQRELASNPATQHQAFEIVASGISKSYVDAMADLTAQISGAEQSLLVERRRATETYFFTGFLAVGLGAMASFFVAAMMGWLLSRAVARPVMAMTEVMRRLSSGDKSVTVPAIGQLDEFGSMANAVESFRQAAIEKDRLEEMTADERRSAEVARLAAEKQAAAAARDAFVAAVRPSFEKLSEGDLTARLDPARNQDYVEVCTLFNDSVAKLEATIGSVVSAIATIRTGLNEITVASGDLSQRTEQQAASLEETVAALAEVTRGINETAEAAGRAQNSATTAQKDAVKGGEIVGKAVAAMSAIEDSSEKIGKIIGVIDEIAFQTNLLALNAGVEAARAGEAGRGFAVVAQEVRGLAQRSAEAAKEIKDLISASTTQVTNGVSLVTASGKSLEEIVSKVSEMSENVTGIARSAREQAVSLREVSVAADQMDKVTQQNAAMVEETTAAAQSLTNETHDLASLIQQFRVNGAAMSLDAPASRRSAVPRGKAASQRIATPVPQMRSIGAGGAAPKPAAQSDSWEEF